jgi:hypothetical protein
VSEISTLVVANSKMLALHKIIVIYHKNPENATIRLLYWIFSNYFRYSFTNIGCYFFSFLTGNLLSGDVPDSILKDGSNVYVSCLMLVTDYSLFFIICLLFLQGA